MKFLITLISTILCFFNIGDDSINAQKFKGTWICTTKYGDYPRTTLHFSANKTLRIENFLDEPFTVTYKIITDDEEDGYHFLGLQQHSTIAFNHEYKITKPSGTVVDSELSMKMILHEEEGRPIISLMGFEYDGRGIIVMQEFLLKDQFEDNFRSSLAKKLNDRPRIDSMRKLED